MQNHKIELSIIIPSYNEENIKEDTLRKLEVVETLGIPYEVIIVSGDKKYKKALGFLSSKGVKVYYPEDSKGKGYNIFYGLERASGRYVLYIDADNDIDPSIIGVLYQTMRNGKCDMVYANKYNRNSIVKRGFVRDLSSRIINLAIHFLFHIDVKDTQTGAKIYKREVLIEVEKRRKVKIPGFAFEVEIAILLREMGAKVCEVPVKIHPSGKTNVAISNVIAFFRDLLKLKRVYIRSQGQT